MTIGLIRHLKVELQYPKGLLTQTEVLNWFNAYETAPVKNSFIDLKGICWNICFSSDSPRAIYTAKQIYNKEILIVKELRERSLNFNPKSKIRLPFHVWCILLRFKSIKTLYKEQDYQHVINLLVKERAKNPNNNILIVSHGFTLRGMQKQLRINGFKGKDIKNIKNGQLYLFQD